MRSTTNFPNSSSLREKSNTTASHVSAPSKWFSVLEDTLNTLSRALFSSQELHVQKKYSRSGRAYWHVYDPFTEESNSFSSDDDVRTWIEQRYYR
jgi:hypothetical protein